MTLLTGFLGSGKTTLLNRLLKDPGMADTAVVINEFGDVAIDHLLVESAIENAVVLQSGCICCTIRGDLVDTLGDLLEKRDRGEIPPFARVAIETTGLADPASILQSLATDRSLAADFLTRAVVTTVDAVNGATQLIEHPEAARQVALADVLLLTKTDIAGQNFAGQDIAGQAAGSGIGALLRDLNPGAAIVEVVHGRLSADELFSHAPVLTGDGRSAGSWLRAESFEAAETRAGTGAHPAGISAFCLTTPGEVEAGRLFDWLMAITTLRGDDILRMKGIVAVRGIDGPLAIHVVRRLVHEPARLHGWPEGRRLTQLVFITRNVSAAGLEASFHAFCEAVP